MKDYGGADNIGSKERSLTTHLFLLR